MKRAKLKHTSLARGTIKPSVNNGFPTRSGKSLKLETLDINSRVTGLKTAGKIGFSFVGKKLGNSLEDKVPLIEHWN